MKLVDRSSPEDYAASRPGHLPANNTGEYTRDTHNQRADVWGDQPPILPLHHGAVGCFG
jgi:hypothetical protein